MEENIIDKLVFAMKEDMKERNCITKWDTFIKELDESKCLCEGGCVEELEVMDCRNCHHTYAMFAWRAVLEEYLDILSKAHKRKRNIRQRKVIRDLMRKYKLHNITMEDFKICIENIYDMCYSGNNSVPYNVLRN